VMCPLCGSNISPVSGALTDKRLLHLRRHANSSVACVGPIILFQAAQDRPRAFVIPNVGTRAVWKGRGGSWIEVTLDRCGNVVGESSGK
jgi:hypothetical protein